MNAPQRIRAGFGGLFLGVAMSAALSGSAFAGSGIQIFDAHGRLQGSFAVSPDLTIKALKVGPDGNYWMGVAQLSAEPGEPAQDDAVEIFSPSGQLLQRIQGGGMENPTALAWDSAGNLYVGGCDVSLRPHIFVFDPGGQFLTSFQDRGQQYDAYWGLEITDGDRIFALFSDGNSSEVTEFDPQGEVTNRIKLGYALVGEGLALSASNTLWAAAHSPTKSEVFREISLDGRTLSYFTTNRSNMQYQGLEVAPDGSLANYSGSGIEFLSQWGREVDYVHLDGASAYVSTFTMTPEGWFLIPGAMSSQ